MSKGVGNFGSWRITALLQICLSHMKSFPTLLLFVTLEKDERVEAVSLGYG